MKIDFHIHSHYSHDGLMSVETIVAAALRRGMNGIAICDHDVFAAYDEALRLAPPGFVVIPGVEYSTDVGHVLALFVTKLYELERDERGCASVAALREAADDDHALLVAAHPFRKRETVPDAMFPTVDGIEVRNSRDVARAPANSQKAADAVMEFNKFATGGSDAHIEIEVGLCFTRLPDETQPTPTSVRQALERHLSQGGGKGGAMVNQAMSKLQTTKPKTFFKDLSRVFSFAAQDIAKKWR